MAYEQALALWASYNIANAADLDKYLHSFRILFAYNSGKIENDAITYNDTREIFENSRVTGYTGDPRALSENRTYCDAVSQGSGMENRSRWPEWLCF